MNKFGLSIILLLLTGLLACRKDKPTPCNDPECYDFPIFNGITWYTSDRFQYKKPCFNPNNSNEFVYNELDHESKKYTLFKYNLLTGQKNKLADDVIVISQPKWSRKGWIAFDNVYGTSNYQIAMVKANGDSLTTFTFTKTNLYPAWNTTGDQLYWQHAPVLGSDGFFVKKNLNKTGLDTLMKRGDMNEGVAISNSISTNNLLASQTLINNQPHLAYTSLPTINFKSLVNLDKEGFLSVEGLCWSNNNTTIYFSSAVGVDQSGLYELNTSNTSKKRIIKFCMSKYYTHISCAADGTRLIGERVDQNLNPTPEGKPTGEIQKNSSIYLIDLNTLKETKINLD